jgi:hypothetical protein
MRAKENREQILKLITRDVPRDFLVKVMETLPSAYGQAFGAVTGIRPALHASEVRRLLPQQRHYSQNAAFRDCAAELGLSATLQATTPKGEHYPVVMTGEVMLGRIGVETSARLPRLAKHRAMLACLNARFEAVNGDLFNPLVAREREGMGAIVVTVNPPHHHTSQDAPLGIFMGIPFTNFKGWHYYAPFEDVISAYHEEVVQEQPDLAWATLKKTLKNSE